METREVLRESVLLVMEQMAFMFIEDYDENRGRDLKGLCAAELGFSGMKRGRLVIVSSLNFIKNFALNVMGEDEVEEEFFRDSFMELSNNIAGRFLERFFGEREIFDLHPPQFRALERLPEQVAADGPSNLRLLIEEEPFFVFVDVNE
jgi:CheY-specific phosphatase CheX